MKKNVFFGVFLVEIAVLCEFFDGFCEYRSARWLGYMDLYFFSFRNNIEFLLISTIANCDARWDFFI